MSAQTGIYGHSIESDLRLARLRSGVMPRGKITITRSSRRLLDEPAEIIQLIEDADGKEVAFAIARGSGSRVAGWAKHRQNPNCGKRGGN